MTFTTDVNLGTVIEIGVLAAAIFGGLRKVGQLEAKLNIMYRWFEGEVLRREWRSRMPVAK